MVQVRFMNGKITRFPGAKRAAKSAGYPDVFTYLRSTGQVDSWCEEVVVMSDEEEQIEERIYRIMRFRSNGKSTTVKRNVTLSDAQAHCKKESTHGVHAGFTWFDGYSYMPGCAPKEYGT